MKHLALYARVSTKDQKLDSQLDPLRTYAGNRGAPAVEYTDKASGAKAKREGLDALLAACRRREVEAVVVVKLDRLARSLAHLVRLGEELRDLGVDLVVLDQGIDTSTAAGRAMFQMIGVMAEFERELIRERVKAGLDSARRRGIRLGRPPKLSAHTRDRARRLRANGHSVRAIATQLGVGLGTAQRALQTR